MRLCELRQKEIINIRTCRSLGCPIDLEFDERSGKITALIVPGPGRFCCFWGRESEFIIHGAASVRSEEISSWWNSRKKNVLTDSTFCKTVKDLYFLYFSQKRIFHILPENHL